jgi:hypothetical protein
LTEQEYLEAEAARAGQGLLQAVDELRVRLRELRSVPRWTRRYPWPAVGAAAAAGFAAAAAVTPGKDETVKEKFTRLAGRLNGSGKPRHGDSAAASSPRAAAAAASAPLVLTTVIHSLFDLAKVLLERTTPRSSVRRDGSAEPGSSFPPHACR